MPISSAEVMKIQMDEKKFKQRVLTGLVIVAVLFFLAVGYFGNKAIENRLVVEQPTVQQSGNAD